MRRTTTGAGGRLGVLLMAGSLAAALLAGPLTAARAAEDDAKTLKITETAFYTDSLGRVAPPILVNRFPPQVVCLLAAPFCTDDAENVTENVNKPLQQNPPRDKVPVTEADRAIVPEGALPVAFYGGARRYQSALTFEPPAIADTEQFSTFAVRLMEEGSRTFHVDSPAFRQAALGVLALTRSDTEETAKVPSRRPINDEDRLNVEMCPILEDSWEGGGNQPAAKAPSRDQYERRTNEDGTSETLEPQIDCGLGATGERQGDGTWVFDMTAAANAWASGDVANHGVLLRLELPPNLAYGDPDMSSWDQVVLHSDVSAESADAKPAYTADVEEITGVISFDPGPSIDDTGGTGSDTGTDTGASVLGAQVSAPQTVTEVFGSPGDVFTPEADAGGSVTQEPTGDFQASPVFVGTPVTPGWVWLLVPIFLLGMVLAAQGFTAETALVTERAGAMTRLIQKRRAELD